MESQAIWIARRNFINEGTVVKMKTGGFSMFPTIKPNSLAFVSKIDFKHIEVGDIIAFELNKRGVMHRVVEIHSDGLICKGDSVNFVDPKVFPEFIVGKITKIEVNGKIKDLENADFKRKAKMILKYPKCYYWYAKAAIFIKLKIKIN